jgi:hypothetical protein
LAEEAEGSVFLNLDGQRVALQSGVETFLKANPRFVSEQQSAGSGGGSAAAGGSAPNVGEKYATGNSAAATNELVKAARQKRA